MSTDAPKIVRNLTLLLVGANLLVVLVVIFKRPASEHDTAAGPAMAAGQGALPQSNEARNGADADAGRMRDVQELTDAFDSWAAQFIAAPPDQRAGMLADGESLARQRRAALIRWMPIDPQRVLELAVTPRVRGQLPERITAHLEERISGRGDFNVMIVDYFEEKRSETRREVVIGGRTFRAFVYGRRLDQTTSRDVPLQGIALDGLLAVHEDPP
jgi:hypothetical protein